MDSDQQNNTSTRGPFPPNFSFGTTIQSVFRNINHAFSSHESGGQGEVARDPLDDSPLLESLNSVGGGHDMRSTDVTPDPSASSASVPADADVPSPPQRDVQRTDDEVSMPELSTVPRSSDESDAGVASSNPVLPHPDTSPTDNDRNSVWTDDEANSHLLERATGTRRSRVDDDGDDARDRRHPSERVGALLPGEAAPQNALPQQLPPPPPGLFGAMFGVGLPGGDTLPGHPQGRTDEGIADLPAEDNNATPGHAPRVAPILTAGFTFTIPLFGPPPGNATGPVPGGPAVNPGFAGMDAAAREELLASFAAFFQEFQATDDGWEDPERAKKLVAGLEVVSLGLVRRLERVGGAPGGHAGDSGAEGASSGCAICWDTLLDGESDNFAGQHSESSVPQPDQAHTASNAMDVDASTSSSSDPSADPPSSDLAKIITLPCAHVFHASCLLPWFTRARLATCPTCRFNIDPENLTYTPRPRQPFNRPPPAQSDNAAPNAAPADPQAAPQAPLEAGAPVAGAAPPPVDPAHPATEARPAAGPAPQGPASPPPARQGGTPPNGFGFHPFFNIPGMPVVSFPPIQIPVRPNGGQAPEGDANQGVDVLTIGLDMFVGVPPPQEEQGAEPRGHAQGGDDAGAGADAGAAGGNGAHPNGFPQDLRSLIEGLLRTTQNIIPQVINGQGAARPAPAPATVPNAPPAGGVLPRPQFRPAPDPPPAGSPRVVPTIPLRPNMFRPTRPMPPRRERKTWTLPPAPGLSLRQRVEQREREQGLRCSDTSCGVGPSDDDPYPLPSVPSVKQVHIRPLPLPSDPEADGHASVCAHAFHPECLVSAERVAGWGDEDRTTPLIEVSCPVCRAVGCVTREEWELGTCAL